MTVKTKEQKIKEFFAFEDSHAASAQYFIEQNQEMLVAFNDILEDDPSEDTKRGIKEQLVKLETDIKIGNDLASDYGKEVYVSENLKALLESKLTAKELDAYILHQTASEKINAALDNAAQNMLDILGNKYNKVEAAKLN